jgi:GNAT superfamily N-acetyltransferase
MKHSIHIRSALPEDSDLIAENNKRMAWETEEKALSIDTAHKGALAGINKSHRCQFYLAEIAGETVGQAMIAYEWSDWRNGEFWWIHSVYVRPEFRNQGIFSALFSHIEALARSLPEVCGLRLYVENDNLQAQAVYNKLGLEDTRYKIFEKEFL